jgi:hypothetical protein
MKSSYQIVDRKDSQGFARYLAKNGQLLLPLVELLEASRMAVDELIDLLGRASIEAVLQLSAAGSLQATRAQMPPGVVLRPWAGGFATALFAKHSYPLLFGPDVPDCGFYLMMARTLRSYPFLQKVSARDLHYTRGLEVMV